VSKTIGANKSGDNSFITQTQLVAQFIDTGVAKLRIAVLIHGRWTSIKWWSRFYKVLYVCRK